MKKRILATFFFIALSIFALSAVAFAADVSVRFEHTEHGLEEYAVITGFDSRGNAIWRYTTGKYDMAQMARVSAIGRYQDTYLFNEDGTIVALDVNTGMAKWKNPDFVGSPLDESCYCFGNDGTLYVCGYLGPDFYAVDINGKTLGRIESFDSSYFWACKIQKDSKNIVAVSLEGSDSGYAEKNPYVFYVDLNDLSYSQSINDLIIDNFHDVSRKAWYADSVQWAVNQGITEGTAPTTFSPEATCTTAQILTFLWRANGSPEPSSSNPFSDVKPSDWYYRSAIWAYEAGIVDGNTFNGNTPCTRAATVTYLWKLAGKPATGQSVFTDVPSNAAYEQAVSWAVAQNITTGTSATTFSPNQTCTRGQIVTFLNRFLLNWKPQNVPSSTATATNAYRDVLNMYHEQIRTGWPARNQLDVCYLFYQEHSADGLSEIGYTLMDLDGDGTSELLISPVANAASDGMIYDLYSVVNGKVVHLASSGERDRYYLSEGNTVNNESSSGASLSSNTNYAVNARGTLDVKQVIVFDSDADPENAFYGTTSNGTVYDYRRMKKIPVDEALSMIPKNVPFEVTSFANYR